MIKRIRKLGIREFKLRMPPCVPVHGTTRDALSPPRLRLNCSAVSDTIDIADPRVPKEVSAYLDRNRRSGEPERGDRLQREHCG